jgi:hypothetical protein
VSLSQLASLHAVGEYRLSGLCAADAAEVSTDERDNLLVVQAVTAFRPSAPSFPCLTRPNLPPLASSFSQPTVSSEPVPTRFASRAAEVSTDERDNLLVVQAVTAFRSRL